MTYVLQMGVAHVVDAEDEAVLVLGNTLPDVLDEVFLSLARLPRHLGKVIDLCSFGLGHLGILLADVDSCYRPIKTPCSERWELSHGDLTLQIWQISAGRTFWRCESRRGAG